MLKKKYKRYWEVLWKWDEWRVVCDHMSHDWCCTTLIELKSDDVDDARWDVGSKNKGRFNPTREKHFRKVAQTNGMIQKHQVRMYLDSLKHYASLLDDPDVNAEHDRREAERKRAEEAVARNNRLVREFKREQQRKAAEKRIAEQRKKHEAHERAMAKAEAERRRIREKKQAAAEKERQRKRAERERIVAKRRREAAKRRKAKIEAAIASWRKKVAAETAAKKQSEAADAAEQRKKRQARRKKLIGEFDARWRKKIRSVHTRPAREKLRAEWRAKRRARAFLN